MRSRGKFEALPHNPTLRQRAKELRQAGMLHEAVMWNQLKQGRLNGLDFDRQKIIGNYIVDFFCAERGFVLEVDGPSHDDRYEQDTRRDTYLQSLGLIVVRVSVDSVLNHLESVVDFLANHPALVPSRTEDHT